MLMLGCKGILKKSIINSMKQKIIKVEYMYRIFIKSYTLTRNRRNVKDCIVLWSKVNLSVKERPPTSRAAAC